MAVSIKKAGMINLIEIDEKFIIITGEMRWRAAKMAGLQTVSCKVLKIDDKVRFLRQVHENLHNISMSRWDVAKALEKSIKLFFSPSEIQPPITKVLSEEYGKSFGWISEHLAILRESKDIQKAAQDEHFEYTKLRDYRRTPEKHKEWVKKNLLLNRAVTRDSMYAIAIKIKRAEENNEQDIIKKIKGIDWSGKTTFETVIALDKIYPPERQKIEDAQKVAKMVQTKIIELTELLEMYPLVFFGKIGNISIAPFLLREVKAIGEYLANKPIQGSFKLKENKKQDEK